MLVSFIHQKGGVGKSTSAFNTAITLSQMTNKIIEVVDLDNQQSITKRNFVRAAAGLKPLNVKTFKDQGALKKYIANDSDEKIIVCDTGAYDSPLNRLVAITSDLVLTPFSNSAFEYDGFQTFSNIVKEMREKTGADIAPYVVFNNIDPRIKNLDDLKADITKDGIFSICSSVICNRADYKNSILTGKSVVEHKPNSKGAAEINNFVSEVLQILSV